MLNGNSSGKQIYLEREKRNKELGYKLFSIGGWRVVLQTTTI